jgi:uncharacterized membrane-anchored protein YitT (DUF2179 family)
MGLVIAVSLLTQFTKDIIDRIKKVPTKYVVYIYAEVLMFVMVLVTKEVSSFDWRDWLAQIVVVVLNGIMVAMASMKSYEEVTNYIITKQVARIKDNIKSLEKK